MNPVTITQYYYESTETTEVTSNKATPSPQHASHHTIEHSKYEASNATRELDDLMASLSEFKAKEVTKKEIQLPTKSAPIESRFNDIQIDVKKEVIDVKPKGHCCACKLPIVGQVITALGKMWHPEHFRCAQCDKELGTEDFYERNGRPYCEKDYLNLFAPKCAYCDSPIVDKCLTALDKTWHPDHFFCTQCGKKLGDDKEGYHEKDGKPYCREHYFDTFAPKCGGCHKPITNDYICALNTQWHPDCFVCAVSNQCYADQPITMIQSSTVISSSDEQAAC